MGSDFGINNIFTSLFFLLHGKVLIQLSYFKHEVLPQNELEILVSWSHNTIPTTCLKETQLNMKSSQLCLDEDYGVWITFNSTVKHFHH